MKTAKEIISYLEGELVDAFATHDKTKGKKVQEAFESLYKAVLIQQILDDIKE